MRVCICMGIGWMYVYVCVYLCLCVCGFVSRVVQFMFDCVYFDCDMQYCFCYGMLQAFFFVLDAEYCLNVVLCLICLGRNYIWTTTG